jgi:glycosyltransferase involved in cell wall biosynthesis
MKNPIVSVILPFRNASNTLRRAIDSILNQTYKNFELILINDGSDDNPIDVLSDYDDPRIKIINLPTSGIVFSLNQGISVSLGRYIARMDADDYAYPDRLKLQYDYLKKHRNIGVVSGQVNYVGDRKKNQGYAVYVDWINKLTTHEEMYLNRFVESPISHPSVMIRRSLFEECGMYNVGGFPEDYELWLRMMNNGFQFSKVNEIIIDWYDDENRLSRNHPNYDIDAFFKIKTEYFFKWYKKNFKFNPLPILIWGTGKAVLQKSKYLHDYNFEIAGYVDIIQKKDKKINGKPVFYYKEIPKDVFILSYVSERTGRVNIHDFLLNNNYEEGKDFYMMN